MNEYETDLITAKETLLKSGVILYPTDTIWGLGCLADNSKAILKIHSIKQRPLEKKLLLLVNSVEMLKEFVPGLSHDVISTVESFDQPTTVVYHNVHDIATELISQTGSVAIRVVKDSFCQKLIDLLGKPITSTSANISATAAPAIYSEIEDRVIEQVDYTVRHRQEDISKSSPSRILILQENKWTEIRG